MAQQPVKNRIKEIREKMGVTLEYVAEKAEISIGYLSRMEGEKRNVSLKNLRKIARVLNTTPDKLISEDVTGGVATEIPVKGEVRAGAWLEIDAENENDRGTIPALPDPRFAYATQFALLVVGTSMDKVVLPGQYVIVAAWAELGTKLRDGDLLVVRRERAMTYEVTLKRARKGQNGEWELWPESTDPRYQEPIGLSDGDKDVEVTIVGKVVGRYEPL